MGTSLERFCPVESSQKQSKKLVYSSFNPQYCRSTADSLPEILPEKAIIYAIAAA